MKQRLACLVLVDLRDGVGRPSIEDTAALLWHNGIIATSFEKAIKTVKAMIDDGHRYRNLQQHTADGIALVLGISLPEYWFVDSHFQKTSRY